ncbi:hypothetical protein JTE90_025245 [Oedothorax gibbosus]|uniref:Endonuclease III homolog n=1 Tax=Oedothorax gibbosus TaxID=931172 RepID=A0AAV6U284_9ARAC|nr:hypothetical protein JTE90_025245 [Oedothorax gibbosus]
MLCFLKTIKSFSAKSSLPVIASSMTTRTLRSSASVKTENKTLNDKETENGPNTSKYFQKKLIKKEMGVSENVKKSVKISRAPKSKPQAQRIVVKAAESDVPGIVITEPLDNDNRTSTSGDDIQTTNKPKTVANVDSTKKIKVEKKGNTKKNAIKTEQISPKKVKTEVLSDEEFASTNNHSALGFEGDSKNKIYPTTRKKQVQKPSIKTEPNSSEKVKDEPLSDQELTATAISPRKRKQVVKVEKSTKFKTEDIEDIGWQPGNWRVVLDNIMEMRKWQLAPVDMMGCEECPEKDTPPEVFRYQTLISVMLSSQTRDEVTYAATQRLIAHGLTVDSILGTSDEKIGELIYPAGFWKSKVKYIRNTTQILKDRYNGDIPRTFKDLCKLPGVGPKMANIVMSVGWKETVGIAVDTHVHRISNRLGWVPKQTKDPEQTRKALEAWLPKSLWEDVSLQLVGFGQTLCKPLRPKCQDCLNRKLCPSSSAKTC